MLICKICNGKPVSRRCLLCGTLKSKDKEDKEERKVFNNLLKAQSLGTGIETVDMEIRNTFGDWERTPTPIYESPIKQLYNEAMTEEVHGNKKKARQLYMQLYGLMLSTDRIHYRITKETIFERIRNLTPMKKKR